MGQRYRFLLGSLLIIAAFFFLIYTGMRETSLYYVTVREALSWGTEDPGRGIRVIGKVEEGSVVWDPQKLTLMFALRDRERRLPVYYRGILPDMFTEGREVIVEGTYKDGTLHAATLMTACPSKYEPGRSVGG